MELRQLTYLVEVATAGTYAAAADALSVAQPALWRQVKELERELGTPLFEKVGRRVRLTRDGRELVDQAQAVIAGAGRMRHLAADLRAGKAGVVAIACPAPVLRAFLAPVIAALRAARPGVRVDVREYVGGPGPGRGIGEDLFDGIVDLASGMAAGQPGVDGITLYESGLVIPVADDHPWRDTAVIDIERLRDVPLVTAQRGSYSRGAIEAAAERAGFTPTIGFDSPNPLSIVALGRAGLGIPILVEDAVPTPEDRPWPQLADGGRPMRQPVSLVWRATAPRSAAVDAFIDLARAAALERAVAATRAAGRR
jgi:DNA-binding transcriptional LysR family regulator